jgi:D-alanine-D-alanine ligase
LRVIILYSEVTDESSPDDADVLAQVEAVTRALKNLGHKPNSVPMSLNLESAMDLLTTLSPHLVFNLVESLNGLGRFIYFAPALLDQLGLRYTGGSTQALYVTTNKILSKKKLSDAGLPTPAWFSSADSSGRIDALPYFIKPVWEDASVGIDENSLVYHENDLPFVLKNKVARYGECLVEQYIPGREFNISILAGEHGPEVLPPAEMLFKNYPKDKPHIVDYRAKWDEKSFEYKNTVRTFNLPPGDASMLKQMTDIALQCWHLFELRGYARVDFRVDANNQPWVLEVNANPCISPDSGFVAASQQAGLTFEQVIDRIMTDSLEKRK